jgi:transaldolase
MPSIDSLKIKLFADGADLDSILALDRNSSINPKANPWIRGFTTNPTLMRKAGILDYEAFARSLLRAVPDRPVSLEVFAGDEDSMEAQARAIASWGPHVNVKIPVTDQDGVFMGPLIQRLSRSGITVNVTAILTLDQVERVAHALHAATPAIVSVFAGRIADTGVDPVPIMKQARRILAQRPRTELLWASTRELLNIFQADSAGCHIITIPSEILAKLNLVGKNLADYSLETVSMFHRDANAAAYHIETRTPTSAGVPQRFIRDLGKRSRESASRTRGLCVLG